MLGLWAQPAAGAKAQGQEWRSQERLTLAANLNVPKSGRGRLSLEK